MWHAARQHERKVNAVMVDHKARAERIAKYYKSKLVDPSQLLRVTGTSCKLYPDAQQFYYHENQDNLLKWQGDEEARIDRFDVRGLLDFVPTVNPSQPIEPTEDDELVEELNFERYRDLVESDRLERVACSVLDRIDEEWNDLLTKQRGDPKQDKQQGSSCAPSTGASIGYTYEEGRVADEPQETPLLQQEDLLSNIEQLEVADIAALNQIAEPYGIDEYYYRMRLVKKEQEAHRADEEAGLRLHNQRKRARGKRQRSKERRTTTSEPISRPAVYNRRASPTYAPYASDIAIPERNREPEIGEGEDSVEFITEFACESVEPEDSGGNDTRSPRSYSRLEDDSAIAYRSPSIASSSSSISARRAETGKPQKLAKKKLTPLERLKQKAQMALEKQSQISFPALSADIPTSYFSCMLLGYNISAISIVRADEVKQHKKEEEERLQQLDRQSAFREMKTHKEGKTSNQVTSVVSTSEIRIPSDTRSRSEAIQTSRQKSRSSSVKRTRSRSSSVEARSPSHFGELFAVGRFIGQDCTRGIRRYLDPGGIACPRDRDHGLGLGLVLGQDQDHAHAHAHGQGQGQVQELDLVTAASVRFIAVVAHRREEIVVERVAKSDGLRVDLDLAPGIENMSAPEATMVGGAKV
ncbi:hypothetical protein SpCBS45565_g06073 [Spizellomyces sp. 'palustris']|nr:hypothetical protein SpCBS45565_g06073 [Spizellomyces sp. 'palustris']